MNAFSIDVDNFTWICGPEDDPEDLCLHGHVTVKIGKAAMEYDGTVSATALYLLKTLTEDTQDHPIDVCCSMYVIHRPSGFSILKRDGLCPIFHAHIAMLNCPSY